MDKKQILASIAGFGMMGASVLINLIRTSDPKASNDHIADQKTKALEELFKSDAFKNALGYQQQSMIREIGDLYR